MVSFHSVPDGGLGPRARALSVDDLSTVASLYASMDRRDPDQPIDGYVEFFRQTLLGPYSDPAIPSLVWEESDVGVIGFVGSHPRRVRFLGGQLTAACFGPLIVDEAHRGRGIASRLLRRFHEGPQDLTFNDRAVEATRRIWMQSGARMDSLASMEWAYGLAPIGSAANRATKGRISRRRLPGRSLLSKLDESASRRRAPAPTRGKAEPLSNEAIMETLDRLDHVFSLRPAYDEDYLGWLFGAMDGVELGGVLRRLVRDEDGREVGFFVMFVLPHGPAEVVNIVAEQSDVPLVVEHLLHEAALHGAVEVRGRTEEFLLPTLRAIGCDFAPCEWAGVQSANPELVETAVSGRGLISRMDGEWWMRPRPEPSSGPGSNWETSGRRPPRLRLPSVSRR